MHYKTVLPKWVTMLVYIVPAHLLPFLCAIFISQHVSVRFETKICQKNWELSFCQVGFSVRFRRICAQLRETGMMLCGSFFWPAIQPCTWLDYEPDINSCVKLLECVEHKQDNVPVSCCLGSCFFLEIHSIFVTFLLVLLPTQSNVIPRVQEEDTKDSFVNHSLFSSFFSFATLSIGIIAVIVQVWAHLVLQKKWVQLYNTFRGCS